MRDESADQMIAVAQARVDALIAETDGDAADLQAHQLPDGARLAGAACDALRRLAVVIRSANLRAHNDQ